LAVEASASQVSLHATQLNPLALLSHRMKFPSDMLTDRILPVENNPRFLRNSRREISLQS